MQTKLLSLLFLLGAAAPALGTPISPPTAAAAASSEPSAPPANNFDDINVQCPDTHSEWVYYACYWQNTRDQCDPMGDGTAEQKACENLWKYTCGTRAGCNVS
ncbi:hypothetical protein F4776DRAFT_667238 [Hypoxylon sp. NC0597]|nr:hypothetical protein F4776DRAFT_667238 [Hypoxylon sp. NC0597]